MNDIDNLMKISTFKMPEAKNVKRIKEHLVATCFSNNAVKDKLKINNFSISSKSNTGLEAEKYDLIIETEINSDKNDNVKNNAESIRIESSDIITEDKNHAAEPVLKPKRIFSPAERLKTLEAILPYRDPQWTGVCELDYCVEEVKNGIIVDKIDLSNMRRIVFGRLPSSDHVMEHPSISRYHAILQYRKEADEKNGIGWYLYDLDSVHGTWLNKKRIEPSTYIRLKVGHILKFGGSTRIFIIQGPDEDQEAESDLSLTELKELRKKQLKELELRQMVEDADAVRKQAEADAAASRDSDFCSWGIMDDAIDQSEDVNPFSTYEISPLELEDPKKTLRGYFDREGVEMPEYVFEELGFGKRVCRIELPIDNELGEPVSAEITGTGKKKELVIQTALEACRILDKHGLLRIVAQESRAEKRKRNWKDEDFYDSDEDVYLDRTGTIESKRRMRMSKVDPKLSTHTFESLSLDIRDLDLEISTIEDKLQSDRLADAKLTEDQGLDSLDAFMVKIKSGGMDTRTKLALKKKLVQVKAKRVQLERLLKAVTPAFIPLTINTNFESGLEKRDDAVKEMNALDSSEDCLKSDQNYLESSKAVNCVASTKKTNALPSIGKMKKLVKSVTLKGPKFDVRKENEDYDDYDDDENDEITKQFCEGNFDDDIKLKETNVNIISSIIIHKDSNIEKSKMAIPNKNKSGDGNSLSTGSLINSSNIIENIQSEDNEEENIQSEDMVEENIQSDDYVEENQMRKKIPSETYTDKYGRNDKIDKITKNKGTKNSRGSSSTNFKVGSNTNSDEINWLPPMGQSGDGKTKLNEKYGY